MIETFWSCTHGFSNINSEVLQSLTVPSPSFLFLVVSWMEALNHKSPFLPSGNKRMNVDGSYRPGFTFLILLHLSELNSYRRSHPLGRITRQLLQLFPTHPKPAELFWWAELPLLVGKPTQVVAVLEMDCCQAQMYKNQANISLVRAKLI